MPNEISGFQQKSMRQFPGTAANPNYIQNLEDFVGSSPHEQSNVDEVRIADLSNQFGGNHRVQPSFKNSFSMAASLKQ